MKTLFKVIIACVVCMTSAQAQVFVTQSGETSFFSETPVENISANNKTVGCAINTTTNDIAVSMRMTAFDFPNKLMQEHFNENYVESEKYPTATFKGKILEKIDLTKNGTFDVSAKGTLTIHGVSQERTLKGKLIVDATKIILSTDFDVKLVDHKIEIPTIVFAKIAEVIKVKSKYTLMKKG